MVKYDDSCLSVHGADEVVLLLWVGTSFKAFDEDPFSNDRDIEGMANAGLEKAAGYSYEELLKRNTDEHSSLLNRLEESAARDGAQLIVTMEAVNTVVLPGDSRIPFAEMVEMLGGPIVTGFYEIVGRYGTHIVAGLFNQREGRVYNSGILFGPEGCILGIYDKVHLTLGEKGDVTPGDSFPVFHTSLGSIGILVCWDMHFPKQPGSTDIF